MKIYWSYVSLIFVLALVLSGCDFTAHQSFPQAEIVYQTNLYPPHGIGFIDADGFNSVILDVTRDFRKPVWSSDGKTMYGLANGKSPFIGYPAYWENGGFKECRNWGDMWYIQRVGDGNGKEVLTSNAHAILRVDLSKCEEIQVIVDYSNHKDVMVNGITGISYAEATQELLYGLETRDPGHFTAVYSVMKMNITNQQALEIARGLNPTWSPDFSQIAYVQWDGIHIMEADGSQDRQVVAHKFGNPDEIPSDSIPTPQWSPDGQWVVYHLCQSEDACTEQTIYRLNVASGKVDEIVAGAYPSWRP